MNERGQCGCLLQGFFLPFFSKLFSYRAPVACEPKSALGTAPPRGGVGGSGAAAAAAAASSFSAEDLRRKSEAILREREGREEEGIDESKLLFAEKKKK